MTLKQALYTYLSPIMDIPVNPDVSRRDVRPYMTYQYISKDSARHTLAGSGFCARRVQFDIYADTALEVDGLSEVLRESLDNYRGNMSGVLVKGAFLDSERDLFISPDDASQVGRHRRSMDFIIWHRESIPVYNQEETS